MTSYSESLAETCCRPGGTKSNIKQQEELELHAMLHKGLFRQVLFRQVLGQFRFKVIYRNVNPGKLCGLQKHLAS